MTTWIKQFIQLSQPADGRVPPVFKPHQVAVALVLIGRGQPLGRYELRDKMSIGEGSTRTLLKRLTESGYITAEGRQGQKLTVKGQDLFSAISKDIPIGLVLAVEPLVMYGVAYANLVKSKAHLVTDGIRQRDEAIIQGGYGKAGATTIIHKNGFLLMPPDDFNILPVYEDETLLIVDSLRTEENDVVVIGSADNESLAREVSMAAVMTLFEED